MKLFTAFNYIHAEKERLNNLLRPRDGWLICYHDNYERLTFSVFKHSPDDENHQLAKISVADNGYVKLVSSQNMSDAEVIQAKKLLFALLNDEESA